MAARRYTADRLLDSDFFKSQKLLRGLPANVLRLDDPRMVVLRSNVSSQMPRQPPQLSVANFNPSVARAPRGLCPRCAFVLAVRVDELHQCDKSSALWLPKRQLRSMYFKQTAIAVLDAEKRVLDWTWYLSRPTNQVATWQPHDRNYVEPGASGPFEPFWSQPVYDTRLLVVDGELFATYVCQGCDFSISHVYLKGRTTADGGIEQLRAWSSHRLVNTQQQLKGRNQALYHFAGSFHMQAWIDPPVWSSLKVHAGGLRYETVDQECYGFEYENATIGGRRMFRRMCGTTPRGERVSLRELQRPKGSSPGQWASGKIGLVSGTLKPGGKGGGARLKDSGVPELVAAAKLAQQGCGPLLGECRGGQKRARLSTTAHLLKAAPRPGCEVLLGVGHLHRRDGDMLRGRGAFSVRRRSAFRWGSNYTHFLYALAVAPPHALLATSGEWCIASPEQGQCESVQFVAGIALEGAEGHPPDRLLLSYGVNDCEARLGSLPLTRLWESLVPLPGAALCPG